MRLIRSALAPVRLVKTLIVHRFLLQQLVIRSFKARQAGSYLGWLWTPLSTAVQFVVYTTIFSLILQIKIDGLGIDLARRPQVGFGVFLMTALVPFIALNDAVIRAAGVFRAHVNLVQRVRFPAEVLVVGHVVGALLHHAVAFALVLVVCAVNGHVGIADVGWIVLGLLFWGLWIMGLSLVISIAGAVMPDMSDVLALVLQVGFYTAPVVYPLSIVSTPALLNVIKANPLTPLIGVMRAGLLGASPPTPVALSLLLAGGLVVVICGTAVMERWRERIPDFL